MSKCREVTPRPSTMSIHFNPPGESLLSRLNSIAQHARREGVPPLVFADQSLDPDHPEDAAPRQGFQARLARGMVGGQELIVAPPSAMARAMVDWTSPEGLDGAREALFKCAQAYRQSLRQIPLEDPSWGEEAFEKARQAFAKELDAARELATAPLAYDEVGSAAREAFNAWTDLVGSKPDLAQMAALRSMLSTLDPKEAKALMIESPVAFSLAHELEAVAQKPSPLYRLCKNGSFASQVAFATDDVQEMIKAVASKTFDLGMEHMFHRHYLSTPDGLVRGIDNVEAWGKMAARWTEAFELSTASEPSSPKPRPTL